jgi:predicted ArsR family transcriptional regulator
MTREHEKLLAHDLRRAMLDLLGEGPLTAKEVATALACSVGNVHYHLQRLVAADLLEVFDEVSETGRVDKRYRLVGSASTQWPSGGRALLAVDQTLWLSVAETGQLVNELNAVMYRWQSGHTKERGRGQPFSVSVRITASNGGSDPPAPR